ncbi:uncharacterized protein F4822DRAFT_401363 [Hypoxylon trugodes]|uniref:uncharacterized protein n=1 Tax=Hypoxylon trugodes TaxID=326681 RepID=UPI00219FD0AC|nr:uncharacterized protein F4822DRAFT_401363 [Hypoxylon trugodes]KAI1390260.1 hypothetical protein F4822DRAFT_401363 [Hypoxylon trugodes]
MPYLKDVKYSREETIAVIRDFYQFLTKLYLPESAIVEPPPEGWPTITKEKFSPLGKSDEVIELLRHLPYIREPPDDKYRLYGGPFIHLQDWRSGRENQALLEGDGEGLKVITEGWQAFETTPPDVIGLTSGGRDYAAFLLDTHLGVIYWNDHSNRTVQENPSRERILDEPDDYAPEEQHDWRWEPAWAIADFFEVIKDEYRSLHFVPLSWREVTDIYMIYSENEEGMLPMMQEIYRQHGWPNLDVYRKEDCLKAVREALKEHYPDIAWDDTTVEEYEDCIKRKG